jgi:hypothetical protein
MFSIDFKMLQEDVAGSLELTGLIHNGTLQNRTLHNGTFPNGTLKNGTLQSGMLKNGTVLQNGTVT